VNADSATTETSPDATTTGAAAVAQTAPQTLVDIAGRVDLRIREVLDAELRRWTAIDADLGAPLSSLRDLVLAGGKRLRPAFCHWAFVGAGGDPSDINVINAGAGLELLHTFALVHDDVMDASLRRRGMDAVHVQFIDEHKRNDWRAEDRRFGEGVAILVGDLAFVYADLLMADLPREAQAIFTELRIEVNIGQYLDLLGTVRGAPSVEAARRICTFKSGKYTIERPLHLGAALAGRHQEFDAALSGYGLPLGEAFQLKDDLLGALGDEALTGKPVGDDLREGKPTALVARTLSAASPSQRQVLDRIGYTDLTPEEIVAIQTIMVETGASTVVERQIGELRDVAISAIKTSGLTKEAVDALVELAFYVTDRDR
jgi:geranylgeranyl diphosphate synthase, type I